MIVNGKHRVHGFEDLGSTDSQSLIGRFNVELIAAIGIARVEMIEAVESGIAGSGAYHRFAGSYRSWQGADRPQAVKYGLSYRQVLFGFKALGVGGIHVTGGLRRRLQSSGAHGDQFSCALLDLSMQRGK